MEEPKSYKYKMTFQLDSYLKETDALDFTVKKFAIKYFAWRLPCQQ